MLCVSMLFKEYRILKMPNTEHSILPVTLKFRALNVESSSDWIRSGPNQIMCTSTFIYIEIYLWNISNTYLYIPYCVYCTACTKTNRLNCCVFQYAAFVQAIFSTTDFIVLVCGCCRLSYVSPSSRRRLIQSTVVRYSKLMAETETHIRHSQTVQTGRLNSKKNTERK